MRDETDACISAHSQCHWNSIIFFRKKNPQFLKGKENRIGDNSENILEAGKGCEGDSWFTRPKKTEIGKSWEGTRFLLSSHRRHRDWGC